MQTPINFPGFETNRLVLRAGSFLSGPKLLLDGQPAPKGPKRGQFSLRCNDGSHVIAQLKSVNLVDPYPQVMIDGQKVVVGEAVKWYQWLWAGLPLVLIIIGGLLGGLFGGLGAFLNGRLLYSKMNSFRRYALSGLVSLLAVAVFFVVALAFNLTIRGFDFSTPELFTSESGGFSIVTPVKLQESQQSVEVESGSIEISLFSYEQGDSVYAVGYSAYPPNLVIETDPEIILDGGRDGALANINGRLVEEASISLQGYPGRVLVMEGSVETGTPLTIHSRYYLVENRLYQVMVVVPADKELNAGQQDFLSSFTLLNP